MLLNLQELRQINRGVGASAILAGHARNGRGALVDDLVNVLAFADAQHAMSEHIVHSAQQRLVLHDLDVPRRIGGADVRAHDLPEQIHRYCAGVAVGTGSADRFQVFPQNAHIDRRFGVLQRKQAFRYGTVGWVKKIARGQASAEQRHGPDRLDNRTTKDGPLRFDRMEHIAPHLNRVGQLLRP